MLARALPRPARAFTLASAPSICLPCPLHPTTVRVLFLKHILGHVIPPLKNMAKCFLHISASTKLYNFNPSTPHPHSTYIPWFCPRGHADFPESHLFRLLLLPYPSQPFANTCAGVCMHVCMHTHTHTHTHTSTPG